MNMIDNNDDYDHHDLIEMLVGKDKNDEDNSFCRDGKDNTLDRENENDNDNDNYDQNTDDRKMLTLTTILKE